MGLRSLALVLLVAASVSAQDRVCVRSSESRLCNNLEVSNSNILCRIVDSNTDCALRLSRNEVDFGVFSEEEVMLMAQMQTNENRVIATIRDEQKNDNFAFEAVAVVPATFTGGLEGLSGARYCHPGLDQTDQRWSPRVLRSLEHAAASTNRCPDANTAHKTAEELEVETLSRFFSAACRPGQWSANVTVDANLKRQYPNLCSLCGPNPTCNGYTIDMGVNVAGVNNNNRHIQALECMRTNGNQTVAYAAWQHVVEYFNNRYSDQAANFAVLCPDGSTRPLGPEILGSTIAPCAFVRQPWKTIIGTAQNAERLQTSLRAVWPNGSNPGGSTWQGTLFNALIGGSNARIVFENDLLTPANYTAGIRPIPPVDSTSTCIPSRRWCVISPEEHRKCTWVQAAAHSLGIQPAITCTMRSSVYHCMQDIKDNQVDFIAIQANYGYLARQHYGLSPVKLVQNTVSNVNSTARVAAFIKNSSTNEITRFENLRNKKACFPEYGGLAYVAFVRAAQERGVISTSQCDYARAVGEFFDTACAPGAIDASHVISQTTYNAANLCTLCRASPWYTPVNTSDVFCAWDYRNQFFGNNGSLSCLADFSNDVAVLQIGRINTYLTQTGIQANQLRALCRNNSLAVNPGVNIDDNCLLAHVIDTEIIARRNDPLNNALNVLLDNFEQHFGYAVSSPLIDLEIFSPFDGVSDLLFKDSVIGLTEPSSTSQNEYSNNYFELFEHLEQCTGAAAPAPGVASRSFYSVITLIVMSFMARFVVY